MAKRDADAGLILLNGRPAKPGKEVKPGDIVSVAAEGPDESRGVISYEVVALPERPVPKGKEALYCKRR